MRILCRTAWAVALLWSACAAPPARADVLPTGPLTFWNDRVIISGDFSITFGTNDNGYFNLLDYDHNALRLVRLGVAAEVRATRRLTVLMSVIDEAPIMPAEFVRNRNVFRPYGLYVRYRPWLNRAFTIQAGRIPPVFGTFARQDYATGNPLIGWPLAYQYPTALRSDAVPRDARALVFYRGRGAVPSYPDTVWPTSPGMPMMVALRWDTGVQVGWGRGPVTVSGSVTQGSLSTPRFEENNDGKQVAGRVAYRPTPGWRTGVSVSRGAYLPDSVIASLPEGQRNRGYVQTAYGVDAEYSRDNWVLKVETMTSRWSVPSIGAQPLPDHLTAWTAMVEGRVKLSPRWSLAGRAEHMGFSKVPIQDSRWPARVAWDAPLSRTEMALGYALTRNMRLKASYQYNWRDTGYRRRAGLAGGQIAYWF